MNTYLRIFLLFVSLAILCPLQTRAADTLFVNIRKADSIFLHNNYRLLMSRLNIGIQQAQEIQVKLYPNPGVTVELNAIDPDNERYFHTSASGQKVIQVEQLLLIGGKRKTWADLARTNTEIAGYEFEELIRNLRFRLRASLHSLNQQGFLLRKYNNQLAMLDTILLAFQSQAAKGNMPLKDVVRLKGVYLNLNNDRAELLRNYLDQQAVVQTILQTDRIVIPTDNESDLPSVIRNERLADLFDIALASRADYKIALAGLAASKVHLVSQRKSTIPDVTLIGAYDQRGGAFNNQVNVGVAMPLPLWNRNQGNIRMAKIQQQQQQTLADGLRNDIFIELQNHYVWYQQTVSEYEKAITLYDEDFEITLRGMTSNFQKRNISLIEFVDFFEAYNDALEEIARIKIQLAVSAEQLNMTIGKTIY